MKNKESKQFVRRCIFGAAGGTFMAAGDWLLGCIPIMIWCIAAAVYEKKHSAVRSL